MASTSAAARGELLVERGAFGERVGHFAEGGLDGLLVLGDVDVALHLGHIQIRLRRPASKIGMRICGTKLQVPEPLPNRPPSSPLAVPAAAVSVMLREEGRARRADVGVGGAQRTLGLQDVGTAHAAPRTAGRPAIRPCALTLSVSAGGQQLGRHRRADQQRQRVLVLRDEAAVAGDIDARAFHAGLRLAQVERGHGAGVEKLARSDRSDFCRVSTGAAAPAQALAVGGEGELGVGDFGHQADLRAAARFLGGEILLQRLSLRLRTRPKKSSS